MASLMDNLSISNESLSNEIVAVNAICGDDTLVLERSYERIHNPSGHHCYTCLFTLRDPVHASMRVGFPADYPSSKPTVLSIVSIDPRLRCGTGRIMVAHTKQAIDNHWSEGVECMHAVVDQLAETCKDLISRIVAETAAERTDSPSSSSSSSSRENTPPSVAEASTQARNCTARGSPKHSVSVGTLKASDHGAGRWHLSEPQTCLKSVFVGRAARVTSPRDAHDLFHTLRHTNKRVAEATHNIVAWRITDPKTGKVAFEECSDDGEHGAGAQLLRLLQLADVQDAVVVVSRWYGGVHIGPERFRLIKVCGRDALVASGHITPGRRG